MLKRKTKRKNSGSSKLRWPCNRDTQWPPLFFGMLRHQSGCMGPASMWVGWFGMPHAFLRFLTHLASRRFRICCTFVERIPNTSLPTSRYTKSLFSVERYPPVCHHVYSPLISKVRLARYPGVYRCESVHFHCSYK